jgi:hypothetical protein
MSRIFRLRSPSATENDVRGDGSFPPKRSPGAGEGPRKKAPPKRGFSLIEGDPKFGTKFSTALKSLNVR